MKIQHREPYRPLRAAAYPSLGDQLDAVMKLARALRDQGVALPQEVSDWVASCEAVKQRYAKPGAQGPTATG